MIYQGKEIEILLQKSVFGKQIAEVKILSIESPDVVALVRKMLIYKSKLRFFGLHAPNQKPL